MNILVIGATGPTGMELVKQAAEQGHAVTALVRNPANAHFAPSVTTVLGDVLDPDSLMRAVEGREAVICSLGSGVTGPFKKMTLLSEGTRHLIAAMREKKVGRLVCITGVGAGDSKGHGPWYYNWIFQPLVIRGVYEDKDRQEQLVRSSGLAWTLVRPGILTDGPAKGQSAVRALTDLTGVTAGTISRADVAGFCLKELVEGTHLNQTPLITY